MTPEAFADLCKAVKNLCIAIGIVAVTLSLHIISHIWS